MPVRSFLYTSVIYPYFYYPILGTEHYHYLRSEKKLFFEKKVLKMPWGAIIFTKMINKKFINDK